MAEADQVGCFLSGLKDGVRRECTWNPQSGTPFQDLQSLISYAVNFEASQKRNTSLPADFGDEPDQHTSNNTSTRQAYGAIGQQGKKRKRDEPNKTSGYKRGVLKQGPAPSPDNWRPHFTPQYPSGSREQQYASALDLCFHCGEKVNVPGKPRIPGAHDRGLHNCPVKMANGMPTPIIVPDAWTPPRKPGSVTETSSISPLLTEPTERNCGLSSTEQDQLQALTGRGISVKVLPDQVDNLPALAHQHDHVWFSCETPDQVTRFMTSYRALKIQQPSMSLCIMVPKGFGAWRSWLQSMKVLREYKPGDCVFDTVNFPLRQAMQILYDPPAQPTSPHPRLRMLVQGTVQGVQVNILLDSGSTDSCASQHCVSAGGWATSATSTRQVRAFNGNKQKTSTSCTLDLCMNTYKEPVDLLIIDMSFDIILGQDWLARHGTSLHFDGPAVAYFYHLGFMHSVPAVPDVHINWDTQTLSPLINALSFEHELKADDAETFMVFVRSDSELSCDSMINASISQAPAQASEHLSEVDKLVHDYSDVL